MVERVAVAWDALKAGAVVELPVAQQGHQEAQTGKMPPLPQANLGLAHQTQRIGSAVHGDPHGRHSQHGGPGTNKVKRQCIALQVELASSY